MSRLPPESIEFEMCNEPEIYEKRNDPKNIPFSGGLHYVSGQFPHDLINRTRSLRAVLEPAFGKIRIAGPTWCLPYFRANDTEYFVNIVETEDIDYFTTHLFPFFRYRTEPAEQSLRRVSGYFATRN